MSKAKRKNSFKSGAPKAADAGAVSVAASASGKACLQASETDQQQAQAAHPVNPSEVDAGILAFAAQMQKSLGLESFFLTREEACKVLGIKKDLLRELDVPAIHLGPKTVRWFLPTLLKFALSLETSSSAQAAAQPYSPKLKDMNECAFTSPQARTFTTLTIEKTAKDIDAALA